MTATISTPIETCMLYNLFSGLPFELCWGQPSYPSSSSQVNPPSLRKFSCQPAKSTAFFFVFRFKHCTWISTHASLWTLHGRLPCVFVQWKDPLSSYMKIEFPLLSSHLNPKPPPLKSKLQLGETPAIQIYKIENKVIQAFTVNIH